MIRKTYGFMAMALALAACAEPTAVPTASAPQTAAATPFWEVGSSVSWNETAQKLIASRWAGTPLGSPSNQSRVLTYLSVAQYNAIVAAEDARNGGDHASPAAAAAGASIVVLKSFFPLDEATLDAKMVAQRAAEPWPGEKNKNFAAGEAIGRSVGAAVLKYAESDKVGATPAPPNPGGPGTWTGTNPIRGNYGARTFALTSGDQFRPGAPLTYGSPEFKDALAEVKRLSNAATPEQIALVTTWASQGGAYMNGVATEMIKAKHRTEREAARILALANMAGFDVLSACFDAKFAYYYIRPTQADAGVKLRTALPNHPSYPSGHSCVTAAFAEVLQDAFPEEREVLDAMVEAAGMSRVYGGLHYRFECEVGQQLGRDVARYVLRTAPHGHAPIPLDEP